jgi:hypothetical protein
MSETQEIATFAEEILGVEVDPEEIGDDGDSDEDTQ